MIVSGLLTTPGAFMLTLIYRDSLELVCSCDDGIY